MSDRYARYRSIGATGTSSSPRTVHDSRDEIVEMTRATCIVPPRALPPGRLQITTSSTQNQRPRPCVSDIEDAAERPPDNDRVRRADDLPYLHVAIEERHELAPGVLPQPDDRRVLDISLGYL